MLWKLTPQWALLLTYFELGWRNWVRNQNQNDQGWVEIFDFQLPRKKILWFFLHFDWGTVGCLFLIFLSFRFLLFCLVLPWPPLIWLTLTWWQRSQFWKSAKFLFSYQTQQRTGGQNPVRVGYKKLRLQTSESLTCFVNVNFFRFKVKV